MFKCNICNQFHTNIQKLSIHIKKHGSIQNYYDFYIKSDIEGSCKICNKNTKFINLSRGYNKCCGRKCAAIFFRRELKNDESKYSKFVEKVSRNQANIWSQRENKQDIIEKIKHKNRIFKENLTDDERKIKYGWLNKIDKDEKDDFIKNNLNKSLFKFWENCSEDEKINVFNKRSNTRKQNSKFKNYNISKFKLYKQLVKKYTERTYKKYKNEINPKDLKRGLKDYHLDHKLSILEGFINNIPPEILSSKYNLQMLYYSINITKSYNSDITFSEIQEYER